MSKLDRIKKLESAKTTTNEKRVKVDGFHELVKELKSITMTQQKSHESLSKSLNQLSQVILSAGENGLDTDNIVDAINGLKDKLAEKQTPRIPMDYEITFERDNNTKLMKSGIRLTSVPRKLN